MSKRQEKNRTVQRKIPDKIEHSLPPFTNVVGVTESEEEQKQQQQPLHVFFIPGNPGLIAYYTAFLAELYASLNRIRPVAVYGTSLGGFDTEQSCDNDPLSLDEQIQYISRSVEEYGMKVSGREKAKLVLVGHSVGAYILLEVLRRFKATPLSDSSGSNDGKEVAKKFEIVGAVLLFPTILDIATSPQGQRLAWILNLPLIAVIAQKIVHCLTFLLPTAIFNTLVRLVTQFPNDSVNVTATFLKSKGGVRQALHMANDEMKTITSDKWGEEIWQAGKLPNAPTKLFFLFGHSDHWVANHTRDHIIAMRGRTAANVSEECGKPFMEVSQAGIPHSFCIRHSSSVAKKSIDYISQII